MAVPKFFLGDMTWPEIREVVKEDRVAVVPVATYEDHGYHLPIDTDVLLCTEVCRRTAERFWEEIVLIPPVTHGYSPHHMDFPGTITINGQTFINYVLDICKSLAHHGFKRILLVNGHGSNTPFLEVAGRLAIVETEGKILCGSVNYWALSKVREVAAQIRETEIGGMSHACEFETSLYLVLKPEMVDMSKATKEMPATSKSFISDLTAGKPKDASHLFLMPYWSTFSTSGVRGDATKATKEKGEKFLAAAIEGLIELVRELRQYEIRPRVDHH